MKLLSMSNRPSVSPDERLELRHQLNSEFQRSLRRAGRGRIHDLTGSVVSYRGHWMMCFLRPLYTEREVRCRGDGEDDQGGTDKYDSPCSDYINTTQRVSAVPPCPSFVPTMLTRSLLCNCGFHVRVCSRLTLLDNSSATVIHDIFIVRTKIVIL